MLKRMKRLVIIFSLVLCSVLAFADSITFGGFVSAGDGKQKSDTIQITVKSDELLVNGNKVIDKQTVNNMADSLKSTIVVVNDKLNRIYAIIKE